MRSLLRNLKIGDKKMIYLTAEMLGQDCNFEFTQRVALLLTDSGYETMAFDTCGIIPAGYESPNVVPDDVFFTIIEKAINQTVC